MNPLLTISPLPYQAPQFDHIKEGHYLPAFEKGIQIQAAEWGEIAEEKATPTFDNTLAAMERSGRLLNSVTSTFYAVTYANTNPILQQIEEEIAPRLAGHRDLLLLNDKIFDRIKYLQAHQTELNLDKESTKLLAYYYQKFTLSGANLPDAGKEELKRLNAREAVLSSQFNSRLIAAARKSALVVRQKEDLAGLSASEMDAAAAEAAHNGHPGQWQLSLSNTTQQPVFKVLQSRAVRQQLFERGWHRAELADENDTRTIVLELAGLRAQKAALLGFNSYAEWTLQDQMARTPEAVNHFLQKLIPPAIAKAQVEAQAIQDLIDAQNGGPTLAAYDWNFYAEQVRKAKYDLQESEVKPYFEVNNVLERGVFYAANLLYGITFQERKNYPVYHPDVRVFELFEEDGKAIGLFYVDLYKRDNKSGGAWMENIVVQSHLLQTKPVIYNVCNFPRPAAGHPALLSFDDVTTLFHEFGHALHGFFADQQFPSLSGTAVARDFVELPSQFFEHWALDEKVLSHYALHYQTQEPIPPSLVRKIQNATTFNQGYALTELLASTQLDMQWHSLRPGQTVTDVDAFEKEILGKYRLDLPQVPPRYRSSYFQHIWGNGYAAGYYAYQWTEMLDNEVYEWFVRNGGMTRANGQRFRDLILSRGNTEDYNKMFSDFVGHAPDIRPMLRSRGLEA